MGMMRMQFSLAARTCWPVALLTILFFAFIDMIIDPVALRGDRWFLGQIYYYPDPGTHFGFPIANSIGWAVVGFLSLRAYFPLDRQLFPTSNLSSSSIVPASVLLRCCLYSGVFIFNLVFSLVPRLLLSAEDARVVNYMDYGVPLGRRFRALKLWFIMRYYGREGIAARIRDHIAAARELAAAIAADPRFALCAPVPPSLVCFTRRRRDDSTRTLLETLHGPADVVRPHPARGGRSRLRCAIRHHSTPRPHVHTPARTTHPAS